MKNLLKGGEFGSGEGKEALEKKTCSNKDKMKGKVSK